MRGYRGAYVLRRTVGDEIEFVTITLFTGLDAVRDFAGPEYENAVILPEAHALLARADEKAVHYDIAQAP